MYDYPENDYRYYLEHSAKGGTWKDHLYQAIEYVNGKKRYIYDTAKKAKRKVSDSVFTKQGRRKREAANRVLDNMQKVDRERVKTSLHHIILANHLRDKPYHEQMFDDAIKRRNAAWESEDATRKKKRFKTSLW